MLDGKVKKGKFKNNVYIGKVKDDSVKPEPLENLIEDPEEEMKRSQSSPLSKHKQKKDQQNLKIVPQKTTFDI